LHCEDGLALGYPDGWGVYAWHGVRVPGDIITTPASITAARIEQEKNVEVRRVMVERMGYDRYILESGAKVIHSDETGVLYQKEFEDDEALTLVHVINRSAEPDGTFKKYMLRVPPDVKTAREAVAWTGYMTADEYAPSVES